MTTAALCPQGKAGLASELTEPTRFDDESAWRALSLTLMRDNQTEVEWWEVGVTTRLKSSGGRLV